MRARLTRRERVDVGEVLPDEGRSEAKYVLRTDVRDEVLAQTARWLRPDPNAVLLDDGTSGYDVHSTYLDTPALDDYTARLLGHRVRERLRVRTYGKAGEGQPVFLENKRKLDAWVVKSRVRLPCDADQYGTHAIAHPWKPWLDGLSAADRARADRFDALASRRIAVTCVHYRRDVYCGLSADDPTRVTIDRGITATTNPPAWDLYAAPDLQVLAPEWMVLELKFEGQAPKWIRDLRALLRLHAEPMSKFGVSVASGARRGSPDALRLAPRRAS